MEYNDLKNLIIEQNLGIKNLVKKGPMMITNCKSKIDLINQVTNKYNRIREKEERVTQENKESEYLRYPLSKKYLKIEQTDTFLQSNDFKRRLIYDAFLTFLSKIKTGLENWKYFLLTDKFINYSTDLLITALIIYKRFINESKEEMNDLSCFIKTFLGCILIASKFTDDFSFYTEDFIKNWDADPVSIYYTETNILNTLDFNINVKESECKWVIKHIRNIK